MRELEGGCRFARFYIACLREHVRNSTGSRGSSTGFSAPDCLEGFLERNLTGDMNRFARGFEFSAEI